MSSYPTTDRSSGTADAEARRRLDTADCLHVGRGNDRRRAIGQREQLGRHLPRRRVQVRPVANQAGRHLEAGLGHRVRKPSSRRAPATKPKALWGGSLTKAMRRWPSEIRCFVANVPPGAIVDARRSTGRGARHR